MTYRPKIPDTKRWRPGRLRVVGPYVPRVGLGEPRNMFGETMAEAATRRRREGWVAVAFAAFVISGTFCAVALSARFAPHGPWNPHRVAEAR